MGYSGWTVVSESAAVPVEQLSADEIEAARLNSLTRSELMAELGARIAAIEARVKKLEAAKA
jgi:hypothetical protein